MSRFALVTLVALLILGCGSGFSARQDKQNDTKLRWVTRDVPTLDPALVQDIYAASTVIQVFEGLVTYDKKGTPIPALAESWTISPDAKTYTFHLRTGARFHSGREVQAADVKYSIERAANPKLESPTTATYLASIQGMSDVLAGRTKSIRGIQVVDQSTLKISIDKPSPVFLSQLGYPCAFVVDKDYAKADEIIGKANQMIGTGPFKVTQFKPDQFIQLSAFEQYWGGKPPISTIDRPFSRDPQMSLNMFKTKEIDLFNVDETNSVAIKADATLRDQLSSYPQASVLYLAMNVHTKPFDKLQVRQAIAAAIDRKQICDEILEHSVAIARSLLAPGIPGHRDDLPETYSPEEAKKLLADAGYPGGRGFPKIEIAYSNVAQVSKIVSESLATQLRQTLGIEAGTRQYTWAPFLETENKNKFGIWVNGWTADYADPQNFISVFYGSKSTYNHTGFADPEVDRLLSEADIEMNDQDKRVRNYVRAEEIAQKQACMLPIDSAQTWLLANPRLKGLEVSPLGLLPLRRAYFEAKN